MVKQRELKHIKAIKNLMLNYWTRNTIKTQGKRTVKKEKKTAIALKGNNDAKNY